MILKLSLISALYHVILIVIFFMFLIFFHLFLLVGRLISLQLILIFLNYESMTTHLQEAWKIQNKVTYSSTIYYNYVLSG